MRLNQSTCQSAKYRRSSFDHLTAGHLELRSHLPLASGKIPWCFALAPGKPGAVAPAQRARLCVDPEARDFTWASVFMASRRCVQKRLQGAASWMHPGCFPANLQPYAGKANRNVICRVSPSSFTWYRRRWSWSFAWKKIPSEVTATGRRFWKRGPRPVPPARQRDASAPRHTGS